jgi:hypothetical protein
MCVWPCPTRSLVRVSSESRPILIVSGRRGRATAHPQPRRLESPGRGLYSDGDVELRAVAGGVPGPSESGAGHSSTCGTGWPCHVHRLPGLCQCVAQRRWTLRLSKTSSKTSSVFTQSALKVQEVQVLKFRLLLIRVRLSAGGLCCRWWMIRGSDDQPGRGWC